MPTIKQRKAFKEVVENHGNISKAMRDAGYDETSAKNPKNLTESKGWKELMEEHLPDSLLSEKHNALLKAKQVQRFIFSPKLKDDEIVDMVKEAGFDVIVIRKSPMGKMAFYSIDNSKAIKEGLDMAYKLKGAYAPDKNINLNVNVKSIDPTDEEILKSLQVIQEKLENASE